MAHMTVRQLKKLLDQYDDDLLVGGIGHFGELLELEIEGVKDALSSDWREHLRGKNFYMEDNLIQIDNSL